MAVYTSRHGAGHAVRTALTLQHLLELLPVGLHLRGPAPPGGWPEPLAAHSLSVSERALDRGVVQSGPLSVDLEATRAQLGRWRRAAQPRVEAEAAWLRENADAVLADIPPAAILAAAKAGVPAIAHGNFSWDWIYREMGLIEDAEWAEAAYGRADLLIELAPSCPMPAFARREQVGELGRRAKGDRAQVRKQVGLGGSEQLILIAIRGSDAAACQLPPPRPGRLYLSPDLPLVRDDVVPATGQPFIELLGAADLVVAKPGYGIYGDSWASGPRLLCAPRRGFPEDAYLERALRGRSGSVLLKPGQLETGDWEAELDRLLAAERPGPRQAPGGPRAARLVAGLLEKTGAA